MSAPDARPKAQAIDLMPKAETAYRKMVAELPRKMTHDPEGARRTLKRVFRSVTLHRRRTGD